jgi:polysaccharide biosynthesis protein PelE
MRRSKPNALWRSPIGWVGVSLAAQVALGIYGWCFAGSMIELALFQAVISLLTAGGGLLLLRRHQYTASMALYVLSAAVLGPIGAFGCALMELVRCTSARSAVSFDEWYESLFPCTRANEAQALYETLEWRGAKPTKEGTVASFYDVLELGSFEQKQSVVTLIADHFRPDFAPALHRALNDPEPAIRVQAASAAARLENMYLQQSLVLQEDRAARPEDPAILRKMALHHEAYARTGLLDSERAAGERKKALDICLKLLQACPSDPEVIAAAARLYLNLDCPEKAIRLLKPWLNSKVIPQDLIGPIAEALYQLGRFSLLRRVSGRLLESLAANTADEPLRVSLRCWSSGHG